MPTTRCFVHAYTTWCVQIGSTCRMDSDSKIFVSLAARITNFFFFPAMSEFDIGLTVSPMPEYLQAWAPTRLTYRAGNPPFG